MLEAGGVAVILGVRAIADNEYLYKLKQSACRPKALPLRMRDAPNTFGSMPDSLRISLGDLPRIYSLQKCRLNVCVKATV